jgi:hypothetical protein
MKGRRRKEGRTIGKEGYKVWKNEQKNDMEAWRNGRKEKERDGRWEEGQVKRKRRI